MRFTKTCLCAMRLLLLLLIGSICASPAGAATAAAAPAGVSTGDLQNLVQTLQTPRRRQVLIGEIKTLIAVRAAGEHAPPQREGIGGALVAMLSGKALRIGATVTHMANPAPLAKIVIWARQIVTDPPLRLLWAKGAGIVIAVLTVALLAAQVARMALAGVLCRLYERVRGPAWMRALGASGAVLLGWVPVLVLLALGYGLLAICQAWVGVPGAVRALLLAMLNAYALVWSVSAVAGALLAPGPDGIRFLPVGEEMADYWLVWTFRLSRFIVYGWFALGFAFDVGMGLAAYQVLLRAFGLVLTALLVLLILQNRDAVTRAIQGPNGRRASGFGRLRARLGENWHVAAILYLLGAYGVWAAGIPGGFAFLIRASVLSLVILAAAHGADAAGTSLVNRFLTVGPDLEQRLPGLQKRANLYTPLLTNSGRLLVYALAGLLVLQAWGLNALAWVATNAGQRVIGGMVTISLTAAVALAVLEGVSMAIEVYLARPGADGTPVERSARTRTLLPLFRKTLAIVLGLAVGLMALATLGVNIGPLLAGAGIVGIAVGFGAQSLVKDVITGMFVLMQDAVAVGDVVAVAGNSGLVEQISIRSIRLRDLHGTVIIIPFSEVTTVQNMTKDFSYAVFDIGIAYREDVDNVIGVVQALAADLRADEEYAWRILEPIEILGLDQFADSAVIVKARIKTKPIQQWNVMREFNRRLKRRFDELDIEMPFPHQTIYFGADRQGNAPPAHLRMEPGMAS